MCGVQRGDWQERDVMVEGRGHRFGVPLGVLLGTALLNQFDDTAGLNIVGGQLSISLHYSASAIVANDLKVAVGIVSDQIDGFFFISSTD